jgi:hypothetical protein
VHEVFQGQNLGLGCVARRQNREGAQDAREDGVGTGVVLGRVRGEGDVVGLAILHCQPNSRVSRRYREQCNWRMRSRDQPVNTWRLVVPAEGEA